MREGLWEGLCPHSGAGAQEGSTGCTALEGMLSCAHVSNSNACMWALSSVVCLCLRFFFSPFLDGKQQFPSFLGAADDLMLII